MDASELVAREPQRLYQRSEYEKIAEIGIFDGEKVELLYGRVVEMTPIGPPHASAVERLTRILVRGLADEYWVRPQLPLAASDSSMPEPDLAVVSGGDHSVEHPATAHLAIEVSETSLRRDREIKANLYAETNIPEYWIVNLVDEAIEVHRDPENGRYTSLQTYRRGDTVTALGIEVAVDAIIA